jgi:mono/diheme cytochrome c family protein
MRATAILASLAVLVALASPAAAQELGDRYRGKAVAAQLCSDCHNTGSDDARSPDPKAPTFKAVANAKGMTAMALTVWMQTSHPTMPNIRLKPETMDDIVAYILSLRSPS